MQGDVRPLNCGVGAVRRSTSSSQFSRQYRGCGSHAFGFFSHAHSISHVPETQLQICRVLASSKRQSRSRRGSAGKIAALTLCCSYFGLFIFSYFWNPSLRHGSLSARQLRLHVALNVLRQPGEVGAGLVCKYVLGNCITYRECIYASRVAHIS